MKKMVSVNLPACKLSAIASGYISGYLPLSVDIFQAVYHCQWIYFRMYHCQWIYFRLSTIASGYISGCVPLPVNIFQAVLFVKNTLKRSIFNKTLQTRPVALDHFASFLRTHYDFMELEDTLWYVCSTVQYVTVVQCSTVVKYSIV